MDIFSYTLEYSLILVYYKSNGFFAEGIIDVK